jgi:hypothetical protein
MRLCGRVCHVSAEKYGLIEGYPYAIGSLDGTAFHPRQGRRSPERRLIMPTHPSSDTRRSLSTATNTTPAPAQNIRPPLPAVDVTKLCEFLTNAAKTTPPSARTPAMDFGRYVRQVVDATPETTDGALSMAKFLRLDPVGKDLDRLKADVEATRRDVALLRRPSRKTEVPKDGRMKDVDQALEKLQKKVLQELKLKGVVRKEALDALIPELKSKSPAELSQMLKDKLRINITGRTIGRKTGGGKFRSEKVAEWSMYRVIPGVRRPYKLAAGSVDKAEASSEDDSRHRAADGGLAVATEADDAVAGIADGGLRQMSKISSRSGRLSKNCNAGGPNDDQSDSCTDAWLAQEGVTPSDITYTPIPGREDTAGGKDPD